MAEKSGSTTVFELTPNQDNSRFLVENNLEIIRILRSLAQRNAMISAFFNAGKDSLLTSVLLVLPEQNKVLLDCNVNEEMNQRMLLADKIIFASSLDRIKIQFVAHHIERETFEARPAFSITIPEQVLQLQRRDHFRLSMPATQPVKCTLPMDNNLAYQLPIDDMSLGGLGVTIGELPDIQFESGSIYPGCRIELPGIGIIEVSLRIQSIFEVTLKNGKKSLRCGTQFINLHPSMESSIQRYLFRLERERISAIKR